MRTAYELCLATAGKQVPSGPDWIHEVKHDGYRLLVIREDNRVRLLSRNGTDWTRRHPWIAEAALKNRQKRFVIDGEPVGWMASATLTRCTPASTTMKSSSTPSTFSLWAAMICASCSLERLSARRPEGITVAPFERGETGPELFRAACRMGLEGLVSKLRDQPYRGGRQKHWIKAISGIVWPS